MNSEKERTIKQDAKNIDFVQIPTEVFSNLTSLTKKNPIASQVLLFLIGHMASHNNAVSVSYATLGEILGYARSTLANAIKTLESEHYIEIIKQGTSNVYVINERVAWRQARNKRQYAIFSATVVATSSENQKTIDKLKTGLNRKLKNVPRINLDHTLEHLE